MAFFGFANHSAIRFLFLFCMLPNSIYMEFSLSFKIVSIISCQHIFSFISFGSLFSHSFQLTFLICWLANSDKKKRKKSEKPLMILNYGRHNTASESLIAHIIHFHTVHRAMMCIYTIINFLNEWLKFSTF